MRNAVKILALVMLFGFGQAVMAQDSENESTVKIHGYGGWVYSKTDGNNYYLGSKKGDYENVNFALNLNASPVDKLVISAQVQFKQLRGVESVELDYAFAEYRLAKGVRLRFGQVKHPFGNYTELYDIGTYRPFLTLPLGIYGHGFTGKSYKGVGLTGSFDLKGKWSLNYDAYAGSLATENVGITADTKGNVRDVVGGRAVFHTPVTGLNFGVSAWKGNTIKGAVPGQQKTIIGHAEYLNDKWSIRGEGGEARLADVATERSFYVEVARRLGKHWQPAARIDYVNVAIASSLGIIIPPSYNRHRDVAAGLNYWFNDNVVLKCSYHNVYGNIFAFSQASFLDSLYAGLATGQFGDPKTNALQAGVQFSF